MGARQVLLLKPHSTPDISFTALQAAGWDIQTAHDAASAVQLIERGNIQVGMALLDGNTDDAKEFMTFMPEYAALRWIALLSLGGLRRSDVCRLLGNCVYDYHTLPIQPQRLSMTLGNAHSLAAMNDQLNVVYQSNGTLQQAMVGTSAQMQLLFKKIRKVATVTAPVLISGESGTGKELAALAIHECSERAAQPFITVNCGALPINLIQSELFGHEKGAFTGAVQRKIGCIEAATGGTIFLDEISELPLDAQVNLLRFLQENTIRRVGDCLDRSVDVRVIAATNIDLEQAKCAGQFREDLFYRIHVLHIETPPLRERIEDIEILAQYFFKKFGQEKKPQIKGFSQAAICSMQQHAWEGNVRELINRIRRAMVMSEGRLIQPSDLGLERRVAARAQVVSLSAMRNKAEKQGIIAAIHRNKFNISRSARDLHISRVTLYRLMKKHGIE